MIKKNNYLVLLMLCIFISCGCDSTEFNEVLVRTEAVGQNEISQFQTGSRLPQEDQIPQEVYGEPSLGISQIQETQLPSQEASPPVSEEVSHWYYYLMLDGLYRINLQSEEVIKVCTQSTIQNIIIAEYWIYFSDNYCLYRMDNSNNRGLLLEENCSWLDLKDGWLYYGNSDGVFKVNTEGCNRAQIILADCKGMVLSEDYIFYIAYVSVEDDDWNEDAPPLALGQLHRARIDGSDDVNLSVMVNNLRVYKNMVYYSDVEDNYYYSMDPESMEKTLFYDGFFITTPCFSDDFVYFVSDRNLHRITISSGRIERYSEFAMPSCLGVLDGYLYIITYNHNAPSGPGLYRIEVGGEDCEIVDVIVFGEN